MFTEFQEDREMIQIEANGDNAADESALMFGESTGTASKQPLKQIQLRCTYAESMNSLDCWINPRQSTPYSWNLVFHIWDAMHW